MLAARAQRTTLCLVLLAATSIGFERIEPSLAVTPDLRITNLRLIAALALAAWLVSCGLMRRWPRVPSRVALPALLWLAMLVLSAALAPAYQTQAMAFVRDIAFGMAFGWVVYDIANAPHRQVLIAQALAISGMGVAILGLAEAARIPPVLDWLVGFRYQANFGVGELPRISSTLPHPNVAAMLLGLALPLQLAWFINSQKPWSRVFLGLGATTELAALVLTVSRAGVLVTGVALAALVLAGVWRRRPVLAWTSLSAGAGLVAVFGLSLISQPTALLHLTSESTQTWYRADYSTPAEVAAHAGEVATVPVRLTNTGDRTWSSTGNNPFELSYHLDNLDGASLTYDGPRTPLPLDLAPGESVDLQAQVVAPQSSGTYVVEWDGVQEAVTWFSWAGTPPGRTRLLVIGQPAVGVGAGSEITRTAVPSFVPPPPGRLMQWRIALRMARNSPLLGVGPDNFRWMYGDFAGVATWDTGGHANSLYFEWLADTGLPGLCLFLWLAWRLLQASSRGLFDRRVASPESRTPLPVWRLAMAVSLLTWFLHGLLDYFYEPLPTNLAFWLMAGLVLSSTRSSARNDRTVAECASPTT